MRKHHCEKTDEPPVLSSACLLPQNQEKFFGRRSFSVQSSKKPNDDALPLGGPTVRYTRRSNYGNQRAHTPFVTQTDEGSPLKAEMTAHSVYREDFQAWDSPAKVHPYRPCDNLTVNGELFANTTTTKDSFCHASTPVKVRESLRPAAPAREVLPFDGATNYRSEYLMHPVQPRRPRGRTAYQPNSAPLTRVYTNQHDFRGLPSELPRSFKPKVAWERNPAAFDGTTEFAEKFKTWPLPPRFRPKSEEHRPPAGRMALLSTTRADFGEHRGYRRPESARPAPEAWARDRRPTEASALSTMKEDFRAWATVRRVPVAPRPQELEWPKGPFAAVTTARSSYTPKEAQRSASCKPRAEAAGATAAAGPPMEKDSVYRSSFTAQPATRRCPAGDGGGGGGGGTPPGFRYHSVDARGHRLFRAAPGRGPCMVGAAS